MVRKVSSNITLFYDSWFNGRKTVKEDYTKVKHYCGNISTGHKGFFP